MLLLIMFFIFTLSVYYGYSFMDAFCLGVLHWNLLDSLGLIKT